jgi:tripartite-type tricarboxylate transporter receptor subunit TctC
VTRALVALAACLLALPAAAQPASQPFPSKPVRLVVPFGAGGAQDLLARVVASGLSSRLGQPVVVENRPSAGGIVGADAVAKAPPDGYTLLATELGPVAIAKSLYPSLPYDPVRDLAPVSLTGRIPMVLVVGPHVQAKNVGELLEAAKSGKMTYGSGGGSGGIGHLAMELFRSLSKTEMLHVPYKSGAQALGDVIGGRVDMMTVSVATALPHLRAGKVRAVGVTMPERTSFMPELPTVSESGLRGYVADYWGGILAPGRTPPEITEKLMREVNEALKQPDVRERLAGAGMEAVGTTREEFARVIAADAERWGRVIREARITAD